MSDTEAKGARPLEPYQDAAALMEPVLFASLDDRRFFGALADEPRALVTLWSLCVQTYRNGVFYFVEDDPAWVVKDVPRAANLIGEAQLAERFTALLGQLKRGRDAAHFSAHKVEVSVFEGITAIVAPRGDSFEKALVERVLALRSTFDALRERAKAVSAETRAASQRAEEARRSAARARWDALREHAKPWSMQTRFAGGDVLLHAKFGLGQVRALVPPNKIKVEFEDGAVRTLVHRA
jgi:electron transfer flavoprotein alpha subunit